MLETSIFFLIFIFGLIVGSFLNCIIYRLEVGGSFLKGRSYCPNCKHILSWKDLIPIFSFLILRGKCRYCQKPISLQYPLVELATGILFVSTTYNLQLITLQHLLIISYQLLVVSCLVIVFVYDLKHYIIPDKIIYPAIGIAFLYQLFRILNFGHLNLFRIWDLGFGVLPSLFFLAIIIFSREKWLGFGDFKLAILIGLILGWPKILVALFFAFFTGAIVGLILIALAKKTLKSEIPFGPFLVIGTFLATFFGEKIIDFYLNLFLPR